MAPTQLPEKKKKGKYIPMGALGFSIIFHVVVLMVIGGAVIIQGVAKKASFEPYDPGQEISDQVEEPPEQDPEMTEEMAPVEAAMPSESAAAPDFLATDIPSTSEFVPMMLAAPSAMAGTDGGSSGKPMPGLAEPSKAVKKMASLFGSKGEASDALVGYLYDFKQTADRKDTDMAAIPNEGKLVSSKENGLYISVLKEFIKRNWNPSVLKDYYRSKDALSAYQVFMPQIGAEQAPKAFDVEKYVQPLRWAVHYKANVTAPETGTFRFVGNGDDIMVVRFDGNTVLDGGLIPITDGRRIPYGPNPSRSQHFLMAGEWFKVEKGKSYPMEVLIGECPGGKFHAYLLIEKKGATYEMRKKDPKFPALPIFQLAPTRIPDFKEDVEVPQVAKEPYVFSATNGP